MEALYWLHSVTKGDVVAFAQRVRTLGARVPRIESSLAQLEADSIRNLRLAPDTTISEYYPTSMQALFGGEWRRVGYDIRELRQLLPVLSTRICRSSAALAAQLGGMPVCLNTVEKFLIGYVSATWSSDTAQPPTEWPPGIDDAYFPTATATYASCEIDAKGQRILYAQSLRCLKAVLQRPTPTTAESRVPSNEQSALTRLVTEYLESMCAVELSAAIGLESMLERPMVAKDECRAVSSNRARYFLDGWIAGSSENLRNHLQARVPWGTRVQSRLPKLSARLQAFAKSPPEGTGFWGSTSKAGYEQTVKDIQIMTERARTLAQRLCNQQSGVAAALGSDCGAALERYWLSYAYVPGMHWEDEPEEPNSHNNRPKSAG
jgi:hypothetical protein